MPDYESLTAVLDGHFATALAELPDESRARVEREFPPLSWDMLSADQRRSAALQIDFRSDPACGPYDQRLWDLQNEIWRMEAAETPRAGDIETQRMRLVELREERAAVDARAEQTAFARWGIPKSVGAVDQTRPVGRPTPKTLIAAELERRISQNECEQGVAAEARALKSWLSVQHPDEPQVTADTIEINIRDRFRGAKTTRQK